jgi:monoamine oxidase
MCPEFRTSSDGLLFDSRMGPGCSSELRRRATPTGKNIKGLVAFEIRFWKAQHLGPNVTLNMLVDQTWETTEELAKPQFGLVAFSGVNHAARLSAMDDPTAETEITAGLE